MKTQTRPTRTRTTTRRSSSIPQQRRPGDVPAPPHRRGRTAIALAAAITAAAGLTALVVGVVGGAEAESPPAPGVPPVVEAPRDGSDQRLLNEAAERLQREQQESAYGSDRRLYNMAAER